MVWFGGVKQNIFLIYLFEMLDNECLKTTAVWHTLSFVYKQGAQTQTTAIDRSHPLSSGPFIHTHLINDSNYRLSQCVGSRSPRCSCLVIPEFVCSGVIIFKSLYIFYAFRKRL